MDTLVEEPLAEFVVKTKKLVNGTKEIVIWHYPNISKKAQDGLLEILVDLIKTK